MTKVVQTQEAKDNANQLQAQTMYVTISGADEKRVREIFNEMYDIAKRDLSEIAIKTANERVAKFEEAFVPKITKIDGAINSLADPSFQLLLTEAHKTAAATEREFDYELLSELLVQRIKKGANRKARLGISEAVKVVDKIDDDALQGLTIAYSLNLYPVVGSIHDGIDAFDNMFGNLIYDELPSGKEWIEHLDILKAVRISPFGKFKKFEEIFIKNLDGYVCTGIKKDSEQYLQAVKILEENRITKSILVNHELNEGYVRLSIPRKTSIEEKNEVRQLLNIDNDTTNNLSKISECLLKIYSLYDKDVNLKKTVENEFIKEWDKKTNLKKIKEWWNSIPNSFDITAVGNMLSHANAEKYVEGIPKIEQQ